MTHHRRIKSTVELIVRLRRLLAISAFVVLLARAIAAHPGEMMAT